MRKDYSHGTSADLKIAYIHATSFPSSEANTFDTVWTAGALAEMVDTTLFVPRLKTSVKNVKKFYDVSGTRLKFQTMYMNLFPDRFLLQFQNTYERMLSFLFRFHPHWVGYKGKKVLYVREPKELLYWGECRKTSPAFDDWIFCYEAHDPLGIDPNSFNQDNPFALNGGVEAERRQAILQAAQQFDLLICNTKALADDLRQWTAGKLQPVFVTLASPLPRLSKAPEIPKFGSRIIVGYIGTIDQYRGVNIILESLRYLPDNFSLRIVGRMRYETGVDPNWLNTYLKDPLISAKVDLRLVEHIEDVAAEIDTCDILIQPASLDELDSRYTAPLKSFGYMMRGKPIVAGDVKSHRELFQNGLSAALYPITPEGLAKCIRELADNPSLAEKIALGAWEQSKDYTVQRRARDILEKIHLTLGHVK